jgi:DNA mismatch endonuclease (patch repair protein)
MVDGCFWHGCPVHGTSPKSNADWWKHKIERNKERDAATDVAFAEAGWLVLRVWEHENPEEAAARVAAEVDRRRPLPVRRPGSVAPLT